MKCNWRRWLWGIIPILILSWVAVQAERGRIEHDLAERARQALSQSGASWAVPALNGRDVILGGRAWDESDVGKAMEILRNLWGVRIVENKTELIEKADKYIWLATRRNNRIRVMGLAPSVATKQAILGVTKANFPGYEVVDRMTLARGVPSADTWLAGVSFALKQLASLKRGDVRLDDLGLSVTGEAEDLAGYRLVKSALLNSVPKGIRIITDQVTPPVVSPFTWTVQFSEGRIAFSGYVPSESARAELLSAVKATAPAAAVIDQMEPGEGAPQGWAAAAVATVRELLRLESGSAEMKDGALAVSGISSDDAAAEAARSALRAAMPATIKLADQIRPREPRRAAVPELRPPETGATAVSPTGPAPLPQTPPPQDVVLSPPLPVATPQPAVAPPTVAVQPATPPAPSPSEVKAKAEARACQDRLAELAKAGRILFERASAELNEASFATLGRLADAAKSCPGAIIQIEGHTDIEGAPEYNQQLSLRRAQAVASYLVRAGVSAKQLEAVGHGERRPVAPNDTSENMAKNRRIEFAVRPM
ncbi:MAG: OmpA family protein [Hyphomicrobiaceae bacterium]|nr:MAG: OmpA family protein [Hyphomicrobiaceae bacterium]